MPRGSLFQAQPSGHFRNDVIIYPLTVPNLTLVQVAPGMRMVTTLLCSTLVMMLADWLAAPGVAPEPGAIEPGWTFNIIYSSGTTGMPKQRIGWQDYKTDYEEFSHKLDDAHFPPGVAWIMVGPTGPRRLRLAIEHLANYRGSSCYFIDLDPRFVKKLISNKQFDVARQYMDHVVDQAVTILKHRKIAGLFTTPKLLEAIGEKIDSLTESPTASGL